MRLIDADALLKHFTYGEAESETDAAWIAAIRKIIREQPTAYDVDKVVELLGKEKNMDRSKVYTAVQCTAIRFSFGAALEIVKAGGTE